MKPYSHFSRITHHASRSRGVALVITVIMLSVILFMAITFLALSRRETGVVRTTKDMTLAKFAADSALERAKAEMLANILSTTNDSSLGLLVSTNFIRWEGFDARAVNGLTNVNYDYLGNNAPTPTPLSLAQRLQNLTNLYFNPRPPVYVTNATRGVAGSYDFRYYLDLNRNGRPDRSGYWAVTNVDSSGNPITTLNYAHVTGDPEWIGVLERPGFPHSSTNRFLSRYAFMVVPAGKTLDINYIHNEALGNAAAVQASGLDFFRNYGVGSWEINLAAFLADLNTNKISGWGDYGFDLINPNPTTPTVNSSAISRSGVAFQDAGAIYKFRMNGDAGNRTRGLQSVASLYGLAGQRAFQRSGFDAYSDGDLRVTNSGVLPVSTDNTTLPWSGAYNTNHLFSVQDFFNNRVAKASGSPVSIPQRLSALGTNLSTYDQYTYYRMLYQLGSDSASEDPDKLNLNYINVALPDETFAATNFVRWDDRRVALAAGVPQAQVAVVMFTNIANRLLSRYTQDWLDNDYAYYTNYFGTNQPFGVTSIPVWFNNRMIYSPSVHRLLQLAANITDSVVTNRGFDPSLPSVFRPIFRKSGNAIHITGYTESGGDGAQRVKKPLAMDEPAEFALIDKDSNIYGVPWIIGAKKGFPNFNEFAMHSHFEITRKMILTRLQKNGGLQTNLMYNLSVSNAMGAEVWNSYRSNYTRPIAIFVTNEVRMALSNELGVVVPYVRSGVAALGNSMFLSGNWEGFKPQSRADNSFLIPFQTNITHQPPATYRFNPPGFAPNVSQNFETNYTFYADPRWDLYITNRVRLFMVDTASRRVVDYVQLDTLRNDRNISNDIAQANSKRILQDGNNQPGRSSGRIFKQMWNSVRARNPQNTTVPTIGMTNQIHVSLNKSKYQGTDWADLGTFDNDTESQKFAKFLTNGVVGSAQVPYTPSLRIRRFFSWQANDPLVHYHSGDLVQVDRTDDFEIVQLSQNTPMLRGTGKDFGTLNARFNPWGGKPGGDSDPATDSGTFYDMSLKDPLVKLSDDWDFHANAFPNIGWLGRIHRGTPWQTVYLKSDDTGILNLNTPGTGLTNWLTTYKNAKGKLPPHPDSPAGVWAKWSGNPNLGDGYHNRPAVDRLLFDVFTTALNENATRGQLPINQEGLAAWSAVLGGVVAITNATSDAKLNSTVPTLKFSPLIIQPAGYYDPANTSVPLPAMVKIVNGINSTRTNLGIFPSQSFKHLGDVLATPELTTASPFLNQASDAQTKKGLNDAAYEWIPQQIMSLLRVGEPRFVVYAYGQTLQPANNSVFLGGNQVFNRLESFNGLCTNYQVTAETAARAVVRVEGSPDPTKTDTNLPPKLRYPPRLVVESYNVLGPE